MSTLESKLRELPKSLVDIGKPSLQSLSYCLRHPDTWPEGFVWDFGHCNTCAMGLARELWGLKLLNGTAPKECASVMAREFAMPLSAVRNIFLGCGTWAPMRSRISGMLWWKRRVIESDFDAITPEMIADAIDQYLASGTTRTRNYVGP